MGLAVTFTWLQSVSRWHRAFQRSLSDFSPLRAQRYSPSPILCSDTVVRRTIDKKLGQTKTLFTFSNLRNTTHYLWALRYSPRLGGLNHGT